jgi:acetyl-CoA acetyltransferase
MAITAENLAEQVRDQPRRLRRLRPAQPAAWAAADAAGNFKDEIAPIELKTRKGTVFATDEHPRPETTAEALASSSPCSRRTAP